MQTPPIPRGLHLQQPENGTGEEEAAPPDWYYKTDGTGQGGLSLLSQCTDIPVQSGGGESPQEQVNLQTDDSGNLDDHHRQGSETSDPAAEKVPLVFSCFEAVNDLRRVIKRDFSEIWHDAEQDFDGASADEYHARITKLV